MAEPAYHTALAQPAASAEPRDWWAMAGCTAFQHDVMDGLPEEFADASLIYSEIPWADGHEEFASRAGVLIPPPYNEWLYRLNCLLAASDKPWVLVGGYGMIRHLGCEWIKPVALNGSQAVAVGARLPSPPEDCKDAVDVIDWLSSNPVYAIVADPCCGFGRAARIFAEAGKLFVVSDINPRCIGHIAEEAPAWLSATT